MYSAHSVEAQPAQGAEEMGITKVHKESEEEDYSYVYRLVISKYSLFLFKDKNQFTFFLLLFSFSTPLDVFVKIIM